MAAFGEEFPFARALVTGASGFIGRALSRRLVAGGVAVVGTTRKVAPSIDGVTWMLGDLTDAGAIDRLLTEVTPDVVFHLAGDVTGSRSIETVAPTFAANLTMSLRLLQVATELGCARVVLIGSGDQPTGPDPPCSPYAAAKWAMTGYARMFHALYGTPVVTARPFMVYGPDQPDVAKIVPYTIRSLLAGEPPRLSSGRRRCDWVYIDDVVDALLAVTRSEACLGQLVDVGTGMLHTVRHVGDTIRELIGSDVAPAWDAIPDRAGETENVADALVAERLCGWRATTDLVSGLRRTIDWYARAT